MECDKEAIKQAIREVLLSEEFLTAFAKAFVNTPVPSPIRPDMFTTGSGWITKDDIQWLNSDDLAIAQITGSESEAYYLNKLKNGESK